MKKSLLLPILLFLAFSLPAQSTYTEAIQQGDAAFKKGEYKTAMNKYFAAEAFDPSKKDVVKGKVNTVFDKIETLRKEADKAKKEAQAALALAEKAQKEAQTALENMEKANADVVKLILQNADRDILKLDYDAALEKIKATASLGASKPDVAKALLEIAFWQGEVGNTQRAAALLDSAAFLVNKTVTAKQPFRETFKAFDPDVYKQLMERYYPVLVKVEGGTFDMGCNPDIDPNCQDDETLHPQEVSSFQMAKHETTWWQYFLFCKATGHEYESPGWGTDGDNPAVNVNWEDAVAYCSWVGRQFGKKEAIGKDSDDRDTINLRSGYRLPTEAEWEYAAKGGRNQSPFVYSGHDEIDSVAWIYSNSGSRTHPVGKKKGNILGLYDMSGNVWEWCWDWYGSYPPVHQPNYKGPTEDGSPRVVRGGSWGIGAGYCRAAGRGFNDPDVRSHLYGFRLVLVP